MSTDASGTPLKVRSLRFLITAQSTGDVVAGTQEKKRSG